MSIWPDVVEARWGKKLSADTVEVYDAVFERHFPDLKNAEGFKAAQIGKDICETLHEIADRQRSAGGKRFAPTADEIVTALIKKRWMEKSAANGHARPHRIVKLTRNEDGTTRTIFYDEFENEWQQRLRHAETPDERWTIICAPDIDADCKERKDFCDRNDLPYEVFQAAPVEVVAR